MAIVGKQILGEVTGSVGDVVFRNRRGKTEMYPKPLPYKPSDSPPACKQRGSFSFQRKTAAAIDKIYLLKELWKNSPLPGYASFEKQMTVNNKKISGPEDISAISLFPPGCMFNAELKSFHLDGDIIKVTVHPLNLSDPSELSVADISAHGILILTDPSGDEYPFEYLPLSSGGIPYKKDIELNFSFPLTNPDNGTFTLYRKRQFVICLVMRGRSGKAEHFSVNLSGRMDEVAP